jgi:hypothetical protein
MKGKLESNLDVLGKEQCELLSLIRSWHINNLRGNDSILITIFWDKLPGLSQVIKSHMPGLKTGLDQPLNARDNESCLQILLSADFVVIRIPQ